MVNKKVSPYKTVLDSGNAYWMARLAQEVYHKTSEEDQTPNQHKILQSLQKDDPGFKDVYGFDQNSAQAMLVDHEEFLSIAFRGTNELADWIDNINAFPTKELFGEFHRGFWRCVEDVWPAINDQLESLQNKKKRSIFLTGHSLGGAMATIAAAKFIHDDKPFCSAYTFGQPRVVTRETSRIFNVECKSRYFRFHNNNDIVTRVPSRLMGYSHVGSYLYISEEQEIQPEIGFWSRFLDYVDGALNALKEEGIDAVADHSMIKYLAAIEKWDLHPV